MSISKHCEAEVLRSLQREPKSTKALMADILELSCDRVQTSIFLRDMRERGQIEKISNGYWRIKKAEADPVSQEEVVQAEQVPVVVEELAAPEPVQEPETARAEASVVWDVLGMFPQSSVGTGGPAATVLLYEFDPANPHDLKRGMTGQAMMAMSSDVIKGLMPEVHPKTSLVIENDGAFIYFAGNKFKIEGIEDVRVCHRMAECHVDGPEL